MKSLEQIEREALEEGLEWTRKRIEKKIQQERKKEEKNNRLADGLFPPQAAAAGPPDHAQDHDPDLRGES